MRTSSEQSTRKVAAATLTTSEAAVLGQLWMEGELTGYALLKKARDGVGYVWAPAKSHLYAILPRLVEAELAESRAGGRDRGPDRRLYRITERGRQRLRSWLEAPEDGATDAFYLKVFLGSLMRHDALVEHLERFRADRARLLADYRSVDQVNTRQGHDYYHHLMLRLGLAQVEGALTWVDEVLAEFEARS